MRLSTWLVLALGLATSLADAAERRLTPDQGAHALRQAAAKFSPVMQAEVKETRLLGKSVVLPRRAGMRRDTLSVEQGEEGLTVHARKSFGADGTLVRSVKLSPTGLAMTSSTRREVPWSGALTTTVKEVRLPLGLRLRSTREINEHWDSSDPTQRSHRVQLVAGRRTLLDVTR